jgi:hypothetical protein
MVLYSKLDIRGVNQSRGDFPPVRLGIAAKPVTRARDPKALFPELRGTASTVGSSDLGGLCESKDSIPPL